MNTLSFPKVEGGKVTDATFDEGGNIVELWVSLDTGVTSITFPENFNVLVGARIHIGKKTDTTKAKS